MQYGKLIINFAPTGMVPQKHDNPHVPITPDEIAADCARATALGASILHLHARDGQGKPTWQPDVYREVILKVRDRCPDAIICVSTSGRTFNQFEYRSAVLDLDCDAKPEMASLTLGSLNFPKQASVNEPDMIKALATRMLDRGITPELEVFDVGMIDFGRFLIDKGILRGPFYMNLLLGSLGTISASPLNLAMLTNALPPGVTWAAAGIGRFQFPMHALAIASGGHVRVGLEDNLFLDAGKSHPATNEKLVERVVRLTEATGRAIATPAEARW
ncbi:MAG: 3-keto-5-aminohexanoate cleavage protein, partial [Tepidisphaeraceae bacterium]